MTRHLKNGDARKRIPPSKGWPRVRHVRPFLTFFASTKRLAYRSIFSFQNYRLVATCRMRTRRIWPWLFAGILLSPTHLRAESAAEAAQAMVAAERKFYQTGQEKGTRAAFLTFLADDGIVFRPGPLNGKDMTPLHPAPRAHALAGCTRPPTRAGSWEDKGHHIWR